MGKSGGEATGVEVWKEMVLRIQEACSCLEAKDRWRKGTEDRMAEGLEEEEAEVVGDCHWPSLLRLSHASVHGESAVFIPHFPHAVSFCFITS